MEIMGGIAAAGQAIAIAKRLRDIEKSLDTATYRAELADLLDRLTDAKLALTAAKEMLAEKDNRIAELVATAATRDVLQRGDGDYQYLVNDAGEKYGYPVCPSCDAGSRGIIQMKRNGPHYRCACPGCRAEFSPVTSYIAASDNNGAATTLAAQAKMRNDETTAKMARVNRESSWLMARR